MRRISFCGETFVTSDGVADALVRLIAALAAGRTASVIEIPTLAVRRGLRVAGETRLEFIRLVAGTGSQLVSRPTKRLLLADDAEREAFEAGSRAAIDRLNARADELGMSHNAIHAHPHGEMGFDFDGLESI